jgi:hypothetical protein
LDTDERTGVITIELVVTPGQHSFQHTMTILKNKDLDNMSDSSGPYHYMQNQPCA